MKSSLFKLNDSPIINFVTNITFKAINFINNSVSIPPLFKRFFHFISCLFTGFFSNHIYMMTLSTTKSGDFESERINPITRITDTTNSIFSFDFVQFHMFGIAKYLKIFYSVIVANFVFMVDMFATLKFSTEKFLHNNPMLESNSPINFYGYIPLFSFIHRKYYNKNTALSQIALTAV